LPELPEVETIRSQLEMILPFKIKKVEYSPVVASILKTQDFNPKGLEISEIKRVGKWLDFCLPNNLSILSHLGMSGTWIISKEKCIEKHTHIQFIGKDHCLSYVDPRRFGFMHFYNLENKNLKLATLGVDISTKEFDLNYLTKVLKKYPERNLKNFLLDQKHFAGVGNYIASEICALSKIRPTRRVKNISKKEKELIIKSTYDVITGAIKSKGTTFAGGYRDASGERGEGLSNLVVFYQKICGMCKKTKVKKIILNQRGTYYCPSCQK
jgi:formamidopyrimidine-DNA glycosylase